MTEDGWAPLADRFVDAHYGSLRGKVRTYVIDRHLHAHLPPPPAGLIDVGGGAGNQSLPLAREGYEVTIVDPSEEMLRRADTALRRERPDVAERVRLVQASAEEAPSIVGRACFAGVLCHGVIMYVDQPEPFVAALAQLAGPRSVVSIVAKNAANLAVRPALEGNWPAALASSGATRQVNGLGAETRADSLDGLTQILANVGVDRVAWYGVRLFTDGWTSGNPRDESDPAVFEVELEASRRDPYRLMSRLFHIVGVRR